MSGRSSRHAHGRPLPDGPAPFTTLVELTFQKQKIEHWIRFGRKSYEQIIDRRRSIVGFAPETIFAFVRPGGDILLRLDGWPKVQRALAAIDAVEALGLDPADTSSDHWRHVHNRLSTGLEPSAYTPERHAAWIGRRRIDP